jgi:hypothetical protein
MLLTASPPLPVPLAAVTSPRRRSLRCSALNGDFGGLSTAIDLRSRLQKLELASRAGGGLPGWQEVGDAWAHLPPGRAWGAVHFTGGAVLGRYPSLCYGTLLKALSDSTGLLVVATPYELGTDHAAIAKRSSEVLRATLAALSLREGFPALPLFGLGHSLGSKLQVLFGCSGQRYEKQALVAFNNATSTESIRLLERFARELLKNRGDAAGSNAAMFDQVLRAMPAVGAAAERAAAAAGLEFVPSPEETLRLARADYRTAKTLLVKFTADDLDQNAELLAALSDPSRTGSCECAERSGNHLSPVTLRLAGEDTPLGARLGKTVGELRIGDEDGAAQLGRDIGAWLTATS